MQDNRTGFSEMVRFRAPAGLANALAEAASREFTTPSALARRAILREIREVGVTPPQSIQGRSGERKA
jgi:hypothetical protein